VQNVSKKGSRLNGFFLSKLRPSSRI